MVLDPHSSGSGWRVPAIPEDKTLKLLPHIQGRIPSEIRHVTHPLSFPLYLDTICPTAVRDYLYKLLEDAMPINYDLIHTKAALSHSLRRAYERYSIELSEFDIFKMSDLVMNGKAQLKSAKMNRSTFKLNYLGRNFVLVFDFVLMIVVTFLPHKALRKFSY